VVCSVRRSVKGDREREVLHDREAADIRVEQRPKYSSKRIRPSNMNHEITSYRSQIDALDGELILLLKKRFKLAREIAIFKRRSGTPVIDHEREHCVFEQVSAASSDTDRANIVAVFRQILQESRAVQLKASEPR
jgi:chorismate mutase